MNYNVYMELGEVVKERVRLITANGWYRVHFERLILPEDDDRVRIFPVLFEEKGEKIVGTYADMSRETFVGLDEVCFRFNARIMSFESEEQNRVAN